MNAIINEPYTSDEIKDYVRESNITRLIQEKRKYRLLIENKDWLKELSDANHKIFLENYTKMPKGLEKKIHLCWFQHCFNWDNDSYHFCDLFKGNWSEVPFPNATQINFIDDYAKEFSNPPNWYEIFLGMNDLLFRFGRLVDFAISGIEFKPIERLTPVGMITNGRGVIDMGVSS